MEKVNKRVNFSSQEKEELISLVSKYKDILENKKTNGVSAKDKDAAWEKLSFEFNSKGLNTFRSKEQLKKYWANLKQLERQAAANIKINRFKTGGGPFQPQNEPDETVLEIINFKTVTGLENPYDDEAVWDKDHFLLTETEHETNNCTPTESTSYSGTSKVAIPKANTILNCKELKICKDSQDEDVLKVIQTPKNKLKHQKKYRNTNDDDLPQIVELKAQYLQYQIEEIKERVEIKKEERAFQAKLQALQLKEKEVEVDILLQQKRKIQLENEVLERKSNTRNRVDITADLVEVVRMSDRIISVKLVLDKDVLMLCIYAPPQTELGESNIP
ncbi:uncharacterized protein [Diabrotica undecimpunctata]|uniref:uncharacterized protein n=1 Tax=Diabrotica undecimpunctata TaxID=50387 RepID=UPI003B63BDDD